MQPPSRTQLLSAFGWLASAKLAGQLLSWATTIYVMRLLAPADYGVLAIATVFSGVLVLLAEYGLTSSLVRAIEVDDRQFAQATALALSIGACCALASWLAAPSLADFYRSAPLAGVLRALAVGFVIVPLAIVPEAILQRRFDFRARALIELCVVVGTTLVTIVCALLRFGIWTLVAANLSALALRAAAGWIAVRRLPRLAWPRHATIGAHVAYGRHLTVSRMLWHLTGMDIYLGGRIIGAGPIGFYSVAYYWATMPVGRLMNIVNQVVFPFLVARHNAQRDPREFIVPAMQIVPLISFPVFFGLAALAEPIIALILGAKWAPAATPFMLVCLAMPFRLIGDLMPSITQAIGATRELVGNQLFSVAVFGCAVLIGSRHGIDGLAAGVACATVITALQATIRTLRPLAIRAAELWLPGARSLLPAALMAVAAHGIHGWLRDLMPGYWALACTVAAGAAIYLSLAALLNRAALLQAWRIARAK